MAKKNKKQQRKRSNTSNGKENAKHGGKGQKKNMYKSKGPELEDELYKKGLRVKYMTADGNCFFRSLARSVVMKGHDRDHLGIRLMVLDYMVENRALFELFVEPCLEDNEDFDSYIHQMREAGNWAGDFEVHAASLCFGVDICIYQIDDDQLQCLCNKNPASTKMIHISYHGGEHYNSVRKIGDYEEAPPQNIELYPTKSHAQPQKHNWSWKDEKRIMEETGCHNDGLIHKYLQEYEGDVFAVIERVIEWMRENDYMTEQLAFHDSNETNPLMIDCVESEQDEAEEIDQKASTSSQPEAQPSSHTPADEDSGYASGNKILRQDNAVTQSRKPAKNKPCPCGSRMKYKHCCKIVEEKRKREMEKRAERLQEYSNVTEDSVARDMAVLYI